MRKTIIVLSFVLSAMAIQSALASNEDTLGRGPVALAWSYRANQSPSPAFQGGLAPRGKAKRVESIRYDYVFQPVVGGGRLFFGSSTEEAVFCLDAQTGELQWTFYAQGPIRIAPNLWGDRIYFGSDDGYVYCLDQATGTLVWRFRAAPKDRRAIGNRRVISAWPVRTSVAIADGTAYFGAGLFPPLGTYLHAVDARLGKPIWRRQVPYSPHGRILVDEDKLLVATGRTCPAEFRRSDGALLVEKPNARRGQGSSFLGRAGDLVYWGPCESGLLHVRISPKSIPGRSRGFSDAVTTGRITGLKGWSMVAANGHVYLLRDEETLAVDLEKFRKLALKYGHAASQYATDTRSRERPWGIAAAGLLLKEHQQFFEQLKQMAVWSSRNDHELKTILLADGTLFAGGKDVVIAIDPVTGEPLWSHPVKGSALGLAMADEALFVGTDQGWIYCFRAGEKATPRHHQAKTSDPYRDNPVLADAATTALAQADVHKGFCLVLGAGTGQLAFEIARRSEFFVVVLDKDPQRVALARKKLTEAGIYGEQVVVHHVPEDDPAYPEYFANLIVSADYLRIDRPPYPLKAVLRMLQPYGGTILLGGPKDVATLDEWKTDDLSNWKPITGETGTIWQVAHRGELRGAGKWTHMYADPANTVCSGDRLVGPDSALQWFGPPGAEDVVERHAVAMPPLFANGKLFVSGLYETIQAIDAYNGTRLWKVKVPESTRMMLSHNAGFMAAADEALFVAANSACWMLDAGTGKLVHKFVGIKPGSDWGYVGTTGEYLLGTNQKAPADEYSSGRGGYQFLVRARELLSRPTVSENLFTFNYLTRRIVWKYDGRSAILNPTITIGDDRVYFAESNNQKVVDDPSGTAPLPDFFAEGAQLAALDLHTGEMCWSKRIGPLSQNPGDEHEHIMFLSYAEGLLLSTRTGHIDQKLSYLLEAMDAATGEQQWSRIIKSDHRIYAPLTYGKNGQQSHPSIVNGRIYLLSHITGALIELDLHTGQMDRNPDLYEFWIHSKTCAVPTASATGLYFRRNSCYMFDVLSRRAIDLTGVTRPGCWMSIIPAGGLVLMPEASSGCTCGFALQTSVVMVPSAEQ